jgi:hypothetical protein
MADNTEETKPEESASDAGAGDAQAGMSGDQNFAYWITMLPFLVTAAVFIFDFSKTPGEYNKLINAAGAVLVGVFAASFVNALTNPGSDKTEQGANPSEAPKAEGNS